MKKTKITQNIRRNFIVIKTPAAPNMAKIASNVVAGNSAKGPTNGAIKISLEIAPNIAFKGVAKGVNLNESIVAIRLDVNKTIAEEDKKKNAHHTYIKTPLPKVLDNENPLYEDILEVIFSIPSSNNILDISTSYHLHFRHNRGKPSTCYSPDDKGKSSKYLISNYISMQRLPMPLKAFAHKLSFC